MQITVGFKLVLYSKKNKQENHAGIAGVVNENVYSVNQDFVNIRITTVGRVMDSASYSVLGT